MAAQTEAVTEFEVDSVLQSLSTSSETGELEQFVAIKKNASGLYEFSLTESGERIDTDYHRAFKIASEKGPRDREVVRQMASITAEWPSYPGVVETMINDSLEANKTHEALQIAERAVAKWSALIKKSNVDSVAKLQSGVPTAQLFVQVLANYEFALERSDDLTRALDIAKLCIAVDPTDPENLTSAVVSLTIRTGDPETALAELDLLPDSVAPYVLYGRALAYYALHQFENAGTAIQTALRFWPAVAQGVGREWKGGLALPKPGEAVSDSQVLYGYYEVFGAAWRSVEGALEWLRTEEKKFVQSGARQQQYVGLTKTGEKAEAQANLRGNSFANEEKLRNAKVVAGDAFTEFVLVGPSEYAYRSTEQGKAQEEKLTALFKQDLKYHDRIDRIQALCEEWPGHANAAISLARYSVSDRKFDRAVDILERAIFALQTFWPDDLIGKGQISIDWESNKPILTAYAHIILDCAEGGEIEAARSFAEDYIAINPKDQLGVRQKAIELALVQSDIPAALQIIDTAQDPISAHNLFGKALAFFASGRQEEATEMLHAAVQSRPLIYHELTNEKHRMPPNYNPTFVKYFSVEEAYNYWVLWSALWRKTLGALAWLRKEGKAATQKVPA